jgi:membrane-bound lytic murein transglycosylase D
MTLSDRASDSASDEEFLDSLRTITADSTGRPKAGVTPEAVQREATALFGAPPALTAAASATWDIDVATYAGNERVQAYIEFFTTRARGHFEIYLARLARYEAMIRSRLQAGGLPQDLVYLALIESGMNPNAVSRKRAVGMWQFIQATGRRYGLSVDPWVDERRDPFLATDAAVRLLRELDSRFGSLYLAAAAYNSGPGKVSRGLSRYDFGALSGDDVFFALAEEPFLRRETKDYVPKLIAAAIIAKQPERYGFTAVTPIPPLVYDSVRVTDAVGLDVLARLADTTQAALEDLNPQLIRRLTPPGRTVWVRVPSGKADEVGASLATLPPRERITHVLHSIRRGETLNTIARLYHVSVDDITSANSGLRARSLRVGREITIPTAGVPAASRAEWRAEERTAAASDRPSRRRAARGARHPAVATAPSARRPVLLATVAPAPGTTRRTVHIVKRGETPWTIAQHFRVPLAALLQANRLNTRSRIHPGNALRIPS